VGGGGYRLVMVSPLTRSLVLGVAAGGRSSLGLLVPAARSGNRAVTVVAGALVAAEATGDKLPGVPSRLDTAPFAGRLGAGAVGAAGLAVVEKRSPVLPALVGVAGAVLGSYAGASWRAVTDRRGRRWAGALAEDAVAAGLAAWVLRSA
jgi:uncharacterized membrane protein